MKLQTFIKIDNELKQTSINNSDAQLLAKLQEEVCELIEAFSKHQSNVNEELADVLIVLAQFAERTNFTLTDLDDKIKDVQDRYPKTK